jgi:hypothetical protein
MAALEKDVADHKAAYMRDAALLFLSKNGLFIGVISGVVTQEIAAAPSSLRKRLEKLAAGLEILPNTEKAEELAFLFRKNKIMPLAYPGDSLHVALAVVHEVDFIVSWNMKHLANPRKQEQLRRFNSKLGLDTPLIYTPPQWTAERINPI